MIKIITILIILLNFINGFGVVSYSIKETDNNINYLKESISLSKPIIKNLNNSIKIQQENLTSFTKEAGNPVIPYITKKIILPIGTTIDNINIDFSPYKKIYLPKPITIAPEAKSFINIKKSNEKIKINQKFFYPSKKYEYTFGIGLNGKNHVLYLILRIYPIKYSSSNYILYYSNKINIEIKYNAPKNNIYFPKLYDMLIIIPSEFKDSIIPLINHKNDIGIQTYYITLDEIYNQINSARDNQEKIKIYIKNAIEDFGISYVLLVGGRKGQQNNWYLPVRYSNLDDYSDFENGYISDLYYSDIYKYNDNNGFSFEDWDSNKNNVFGEWNRDSTIKDYLDLYPDVYVGRLPCRSILEVKNIVKKLINYETMIFNQNWFKKMIIVGGDTFPNSINDFEGEIETNLSASYLEKKGFEIIRLHASDNTLKKQIDVIKAINKGAGFIHFAGHGNPSVWSTHPPNDNIWIDGLYTYSMDQLYNQFKLPICIVGGCHNSQFNVTLNNIIDGIINEGINYFLIDGYDYGDFWKYEWIPKCWSWKFISCPKTGSIATIGNTGLGYGYAGNYTLQGLGGWIEPRFFYNYANEEKEILGETHSSTIIDYINTFDVNKDKIDRKTIEQWVLLGDPSLKIGGRT